MTKDSKKKKSFKQKITRKYAFVIEDSDNFEKLYSLKLSRLNIFVFGGVFSFFVVAITSLIIAYTPLKEYIPGYDPLALRQDATDLIFELDSLENVVALNNAKMEALIPVLNGEIEADTLDFEALEIGSRGSELSGNEVFEPTDAELSLREEVAKEDRFALFQEARKSDEIVFFTPVSGSITQGFSSEQKHFAVDLAVKKGTPVKSIADGVVLFSEWTTETGYVIIVQHRDEYVSIYKHNESLNKEQGDLVKFGEVIATVGSTGSLSSGTHLHFELWNNGYPVNPENFIDFE